jgi:hypothetical protein
MSETSDSPFGDVNGDLMDAFDPEVQHQRAAFVKAESADIRARRDRALATVGLTKAELRARVVDYSRGEPTPDERDAWYEVDVCNFLLDED